MPPILYAIPTITQRNYLHAPLIHYILTNTHTHTLAHSLNSWKTFDCQLFFYIFNQFCNKCHKMLMIAV